MLKMKYLFFCFFLYSALLSAQEVGTSIDRDQFDQLMMEEKLEEAVNQYREEKKLPIFLIKDNLNAAAFDQAEYNQKNKKEGHTQEKESMKTTPLRVKHYGGMFYEMGELIYTASLGRAIRVLGEESIKLSTYEEVANAAVKEWSKNEKINEIINSLDYYSLGVAASMNEDKTEISIVCILATAEYQIPQNSKVSDDDFGLKPYQKSDCDMFMRENPFLPELLSDKLEIKNNKVFLKNDDRELLIKIMSSSKDGFAVDLVTKNQFDCKNGNALYPSDIHFGWLLKPIKASNLNYKDAAGNYKPEIELGELPKGYTNLDLNTNLLVFKNNTVCAYIPENYTQAQNLHWIKPEWEIKLPPTTNQLYLVQSKSVSSEDLDQVKKALNDLKSISNQLDSLQIIINWSPLLSVDSSNLKKIVTDFINGSVPIAIGLQFNNNWKKIQNFIANKSIALELKTLSPKEQIELLNQQEDSVWNSFKTSIHQTELIYTVKKSKAGIAENELIVSYKKALDLQATASALSIQKELIERAEKGNVKARNALAIEGVKQTKKLLVLISNAAIVLHQLEGESTAVKREQLRKTFLGMYLIDKNNPIIAYNLCLSTLYQWEKNKNAPIRPEMWEEYFKSASLNGAIDKDKLDKLNTNFHLLSADYYYDAGNVKDRTKSLQSAYDNIIKTKNTQEENISYAQYFMFQLQIESAANILKKQLENQFDLTTAQNLLSLSSYPSANMNEEETVKLLLQLYEKDAVKFCNLFSDKYVNYLILGNLKSKNKFCQSCK